MPISRPLGKVMCAKPRSMVIPRRFSSASRSGSIPVRAVTSVDLPWSMWPAVPTTKFISAMLPPPSRPRRQHCGNERSEEHTSELQSRLHLVCRLLLEKKKNKYENGQLRSIPHTPPDLLEETKRTSRLYTRRARCAVVSPHACQTAIN